MPDDEGGPGPPVSQPGTTQSVTREGTPAFGSPVERAWPPGFPSLSSVATKRPVQLPCGGGGLEGVG